MQATHETAIRILQVHDGVMNYDDFSRALADDATFDFIESPGDMESFICSLEARGLVRLSNNDDDGELYIKLIVAPFAEELARLASFLTDNGGFCGLTVLEPMFGPNLPEWGARQRVNKIVDAGVTQNKITFNQTTGIVMLSSAGTKRAPRKSKPKK